MERFASMNDQGSEQSSTQELIGAVRELISLMGKGGISELDLTSGNVSIRLRGSGTGTAPAPAASANGDSSTASAAEEEEGHVITAPMIGTFYAAPSPGEDPFVQVGDEVEVGQVIGIIEAMKIMNEIESEFAGTVVEVLSEDAHPVEYGQVLFRIDPNG